eukprot:CAMPEP_0184483158 /NCGR_PEP_ID=MMETSP0113_2-20130426/4786_1 /TAXON_ID=91329 /ORGANISM="Norrisiella sphaerica, Strain BC52" /LENGTH=457 /DNA_ID=CAMNT_0026863373 /DNA_START=44 /DNA_END=1417 /DNA_ORIENTATION=-
MPTKYQPICRQNHEECVRKLCFQPGSGSVTLLESPSPLQAPAKTEKEGDAEAKKKARVCSYLLHRAGQRLLPFGERDAFQASLSRKRTRESFEKTADAAPQAPRDPRATNWDMSNGLLRSPVGRRVSSRHGSTLRPADAQNEPTSSSAPPEATTQNGEVPPAQVEVEDAPKVKPFVEKLPDPFALFDAPREPQKTAASRPSVRAQCKADTTNSRNEPEHKEVKYSEIPSPDLGLHDGISRDIMRKAVALELLGEGFDGAKGQALDVLTDLTVDYLKSFGKELQNLMGQYHLEQGVHTYSLMRDNNKANWQPRILRDLQHGPEQPKRSSSVKKNTLTSEGSRNNNQSRRKKNSPTNWEPGILNTAPCLKDLSILKQMGPNSNAVGKATLQSALHSVALAYDDIQDALLPSCFAKMGVAPSSLLDHLQLQRLKAVAEDNRVNAAAASASQGSGSVDKEG